MMNSILLLCYRALFMPFVASIALIIAPFHKKIKEGLKMRMQQKLKPLDQQGQPLWFHCSSGEFEYAKFVIHQLKLKEPNTPIIVTYFSPSYKDNVENCSDVDLALPAPWDFPGPMNQFIKKYKPKALLIARTDLWPEMLTQCRLAKIPTLLFSCSKAQPKWYQLLKKFYYNWVLALVDQIYCVSDDDQENLKLWSPGAQVKVRGDTRYDQVTARLTNPRPIKEELFSSFSGLTMVCGSTWFEDEDELIDLLPLVNDGQLRLVMAPHEPNLATLQHLAHFIEEKGGSSILYSKSTEWTPNSVMLIDRIGILAELYMKADMAFVGGSFKSTVHSVMEPLAARALTFVGPKHLNNREAIEFQSIPLEDGLSAVTVIPNGQILLSHIQHLLKRRDILTDSQAKIRSELLKNEGASQWVMDWIQLL